MAITTLHPVLIHGRSAWDLGELPRDEYEERRRLVRQILEDHDLTACVILGSTTAYANVAYLTGSRPGFMSSVMLVHRDHDTVLFAGLGGGRDLYHVRAVNFIDDVRYYPSPGEGVRTVLGEWGEAGGRLGIVGAAADVPLETVTRVEQGLDGFDLVALDQAFFQLRRRKRPRERALIARSAALVTRARDAAVAEFIATGVPYQAAIAAERTARVLGARDVRTLANLGSGPELRPITGTSGPRAEHLVLHVGLERAGYWAETTISFPRVAGGGSPAARGLAAMREAARPGMSLASVADAGLSCLDGDEARSLALEIGLGQGVGLGVEEELAVAPSSTAVLEGGETLSLRCVVAGADGGWSADATLVEVVDDGARALIPAWWS